MQGKYLPRKSNYDGQCNKLLLSNHVDKELTGGQFISGYYVCAPSDDNFSLTSTWRQIYN
jgi:hypothetical protein